MPGHEYKQIIIYLVFIITKVNFLITRASHRFVVGFWSRKEMTLACSQKDK